MENTSLNYHPGNMFRKKNISFLSLFVYFLDYCTINIYISISTTIIYTLLKRWGDTTFEIPHDVPNVNSFRRDGMYTAIPYWGKTSN